MGEAGDHVKAKVDEIRENPRAEKAGSALKFVGNLADTIPSPAGKILKGVCSMGAAVLNPDPTLADLRRAKEDKSPPKRN